MDIEDAVKLIRGKEEQDKLEILRNGNSFLSYCRVKRIEIKSVISKINKTKEVINWLREIKQFNANASKEYKKL